MTCLIGISLAGCDKNDQRDETDEVNVQYVMPAESDPHEGTWLQWPQKYQYGVTYRDRLEPTWIAIYNKR